MEKFIIAEDYGNELNAGSKATNDILSILSQNGYTKISINTKLILKYSKKYKEWKAPKNIFEKLNSKYKMFKLTFHSFFALNSLSKKIIPNSELFVQYPFIQLKMRPELQKNIFYRTIKNKNITLCILVHDLNGLRLGNKRLQNRDIEFLKFATKIIVHNQEMKSYLVSNGIPQENITFIDFFDYLHTPTQITKHKKDEPIVFAGNLNRFGFLHNLRKLPQNINLNLYGSWDFNKKFPKNINYCKCLNSESLPSELKGGWGLVWEGSSLTTCNGQQGEYLKYNSSHKNSLYIVARMPIIIWSNAALAPKILEKNIGITVDSLFQIPEKINAITESQYETMLQNLELLAKDLENGKNILQVLN